MHGESAKTIFDDKAFCYESTNSTASRQQIVASVCKKKYRELVQNSDEWESWTKTPSNLKTCINFFVSLMYHDSPTGEKKEGKKKGYQEWDLSIAVY